VPNLDFYAVGSDFDPILDFVFEQSGCHVFESYSAPGTELLRFHSADELRARHEVGVSAGSSASIHLQLVPPGATKSYQIERIRLDPAKCNGHTFRYSIRGWGLIQLYLGGIGPHGVTNSHTNHNTQSRAQKWEPIISANVDADDWNWREVNSTSGKLNRQIRKLCAYKLGSRPVLPAAAEAFAAGSRPAMTFDAARVDAMLVNSRTS